MVAEIYTVLIVFLIFIFLSAFTSVAEVVYSAERKKLLHSIDKEKDRNLYELLRNPEKFFSTTLALNNIFNISITVIITTKAKELGGELWVAIATVFVTISIILFGEVIPKAWGLKNSHELAKIIIKIIILPYRFLSPFLKPIEKIMRTSSTEELKAVLSLDRFSKEQIKMVEGVSRLAELELQDIMIHRNEVRTLDVNMTLEEVIKLIEKTKHTRYPVLSDGKVVGICLSKNLIPLLFKQRGSGEIAKKKLGDLIFENPDIVAPARISAPSKSVLEQLTDFKKWRTHMVCIINDRGEFEGIATLEDILEEIIGDIEDEFSEKKEFFWVSGENIYVKGEAAIRDINRELGLQISEKYPTVSSTILSVLGRLPEKGEKIYFDGYQFEVVDISKNKINLVKITKRNERKDSGKEDSEDVELFT